MNKRELALLERAFDREVAAALHGAPYVMQARGKLVQKLVDDGLLEEHMEVIGGRFPVAVSGYCLTHAGRIAYCSSCDREGAA